MFDAKELGYRGPSVSASDAVEEARYMYAKMAREELEAGREIPVVDLPYEVVGDVGRESVEAGDELLRAARTVRFSFSALARRNYDRIFRKHVEKDS